MRTPSWQIAGSQIGGFPWFPWFPGPDQAIDRRAECGHKGCGKNRPHNATGLQVGRSVGHKFRDSARTARGFFRCSASSVRYPDCLRLPTVSHSCRCTSANRSITRRTVGHLYARPSGFIGRLSISYRAFGRLCPEPIECQYLVPENQAAPDEPEMATGGANRNVCTTRFSWLYKVPSECFTQTCLNPPYSLGFGWIKRHTLGKMCLRFYPGSLPRQRYGFSN